MEEVRKDMEEVLAAGTCDLRAAFAIQKLPAAERPALAIRLVDSPHAAMRMQAVLILRTFPPKVAAETFRKLVKDEDPGVRNEAARYLAREAKDAEARALLLKSAADPNPKVAGGAIGALAALGGPDVGPLLRKLLEDSAAPREARLAAIQAAGPARAAECTPALVALLGDPARRGQGPGDTVQVCDMAAAALESIHGVNHIVPPGAYYNGPVDKRDEGIALWRAWAEKGPPPSGQQKEASERPAAGVANERGAFEDASHRGAVRRDAWPSPRDGYLDRVLDESLKTLGESRDPAKRAEAVARLRAAFQATFCLGELPGVDALVASSVRDAWRIMQVSGERWWYKALRPWQDLDLAFRRRFLPDAKGLDAAPDAQAAAFLAFAEGEWKAHRTWTWALARSFAEVFPTSPLTPKAEEVKARVEADLRKEKLRIVLHGHIPVAEPMAKPAAPSSNMRPDGYMVHWMNVSGEPSNWAHHRAAIEFWRQAKEPMADYPYFAQQSVLYLGSEYPFLSSAAYQLRVKANPKLGMDFADKAVLLNPANAKCHAIRGIIRVVSGDSPDQAAKDLRRAFELDPGSLGDEPETAAAATFLAEKTLAAGDMAPARAVLKALGDLRPYPAGPPLAQSAEFQKLLQRAAGM